MTRGVKVVSVSEKLEWWLQGGDFGEVSLRGCLASLARSRESQTGFGCNLLNHLQRAARHVDTMSTSMLRSSQGLVSTHRRQYGGHDVRIDRRSPMIRALV